MSELTTTEEPRWTGLREVLRMAAPIVLGSLSYTVMQFVDQIMVARLGKDALAASGTAGLALFVLSCFFIGMVGCVSTFVSQSLGRGVREDCAHYTWQGVYLSVATSLVGLAFWPLSGPLFDLLPHEPEVIHLERMYFRVRLLGFVFMTWQAGLTCFFQGVNRPGIPMWTALLANALNIPLNYVLIFGKFGFPEWGIGGAAAATVIAQGAQVCLLQYIFLSPGIHAEFGTRTARAVDWAKLRELVRIGIPGGLSLFLDIFNWSVFTMLIVGRFGTTALAAHNAAISFMTLSFLPALGLNQAIAPIVGQWIGRGDIARAKARTYTAMRLAIAYMTPVGLAMALAGKPLIALCFSQDPEVIALGSKLLVLAAVFQGFDAINIALFGALRGAGDTRWTMFAAIVMGYALFLPLAWGLAVILDWGALGAWVAATVYIMAFSGAVLHRFHGEGWRHIRIFKRDLEET
jgi:MATE family, multidrug efflux pump